MPDREELLKNLDKALEPHVTKFPKGTPQPDTITSIIDGIRESSKRVLAMCDLMDKIIAESEGDARQAADVLLAMVSRIK